MSIRSDNARLLRQLSLYLNLMPDAIDGEMVDSIAMGFDKEQREYAYATLLATYCGFDIVDSKEDKSFFRERFTRMVYMQDKSRFLKDKYYANIKFPNVENESWQFKTMSFKPYEAFLANESVLDENGRLFPKIGFFEERFDYPAVLQDGREWMTVTPHEIRTTMPAVNESCGNVLTYGLGLGYFAYMASLKENVKSVTVVEKDERVIELFRKYLLCQFPEKSKIVLVCDDAFEYAKNTYPKKNYDFVFADTWHDPSDGVDMYLRFKELEMGGNTRYMYWIEDTLKYYLSLDKNSVEDTSPIFKDGTKFQIKFIEN